MGDAVPDARRMMVLCSLALLFMLLSVFGVLIYSIYAIDNSAIDAEMARARIALTVQAAESVGSDAALASRLANNYGLEGARFGQATAVSADEVALPVPGRSDVLLIWTPHRFGRELFFHLAPLRIGASAVFLAGILVVMRRLYRLARELDDRRREALALAARDSLTGLGNRLAFDDGMRQALKSGAGDVALFYLDLDGFKQVNDTLGHGAGDDVLRMVGQRLTNLVHDTDIVARMGGDEFAVLRAAPGSNGDLVRFALAIETALAEPLLLGAQSVQIAASIGIAVAPADGRTGAELMAAADAALYRAKRDRSGFARAEAA